MRNKVRIVTLRLAALLTSGLLLAACGSYNGNSTTTGSSGPTAILNGATLATANTHWVSQACNVQVELTADGGFWSIVADISGTTTSMNNTWTIGSTPNNITIGPGSGEASFTWVSSLTNISGSTSSKSFSAGVTTLSGSDIQSNLGSCEFTLSNGGLS